MGRRDYDRVSRAQRILTVGNTYAEIGGCSHPVAANGTRQNLIELVTTWPHGEIEDPCWDSEFEGDDAVKSKNHDTMHGQILSYVVILASVQEDSTPEC
jgi:hypothetical protein